MTASIFVIMSSSPVLRPSRCRRVRMPQQLAASLYADASKGRRDLCPLDHRDLVANGKLADIVKLRLVEALSFKSNQADRQAGRVELQHYRRQCSGRQTLQIRHSKVR